ncbi:hypothetical protein AIOL_001459 [Candidatus Rhodobacter oscarellae]|uniref:Lysozyme inhibitor LprI N-terminal domain-containing protein n=1 Tax=Candidatus Rhodobacter oscarellae TaxID=1675527 RepID=A0A0J9E191_9RHOB|nr:hypothetical protein [Candidatus Rhodobacter lobularis]KMW56505.1 hypothetical protein AIOL_001459 [Candidatus Rhodobacter lobularis]
MRFPILLAVALLLGAAKTPVWADELPPIEPQLLPAAKAPTVACIGTLDNGRTWGECMALLFEPCAATEVGSSPHLTCLLAERETWLSVIAGEQEAVNAVVSSKGAIELGQLMNQWFGYVGNKCAEVGAGKGQTGADTAQVGCEMSQMVSLVAELVDCREGRSQAPYCVRQE